MARYYFDSSDGEVMHHDEVGTECATDDLARAAALTALADLARQYLPSAGHNYKLQQWLRDADGRELLRLELTLTFDPSH